ncbi:apolipoprotein C-IV [Syngnathus acus]|uniref:apolipoprotein C-IV n=1 Tax=Syngnathus acus TaxID=161584 RepID=UPI0018862CB4|nr:apolipoprotein C-IV [Syngnathus acus]
MNLRQTNKQKMRFLVIALILLVQACGSLRAQTLAPDASESPGVLQRLLDKARAAKEKVEMVRDTVTGFASEYYDEHIQPTVDSYSRWAAGVSDAAREKILDYLPFFATNTSSQGAM